MSDLIKLIAIVLIAGAAGGFIAGLVGGKSTSFGGTTNYDIVSAARMQIGSGCDNANTTCAGTQLSQVQKGTCSLIASSFTITASTSLAVDCAVTGVVSGDTVFAQFATSTSAGAGWLVTQVAASTTSGFITFNIVNNTGTNAVIPASIASTTRYLILR